MQAPLICGVPLTPYHWGGGTHPACFLGAQSKLELTQNSQWGLPQIWMESTKNAQCGCSLFIWYRGYQVLGGNHHLAATSVCSSTDNTPWYLSRAC